MRNKTLELHFDFGSPTTYMTYTQVPRIAQEAGSTLIRQPAEFGTPTLFVGDPLFFGQDRPDFVREALTIA